MKIQKSDSEIMEEYGMAELPLILYKLYKKYNANYELIDIGGDCMFRFGETNVANVSYLATYVNFLKIEQDILRIEGNVSWPTVLLEHFQLYIEINGELHTCEMYDAGLDKSMDGEVYETRTAFVYQMQLEDMKEYRIRFVYSCKGIHTYSGKINYMRFSPIADVLENQYAQRNGWILKNIGACIHIQLGVPENILQSEDDFCDSIKREDVIRIRKKYFEKKQVKNKQIWLFMDRIDRADDNGEVFFRYMNRRHLGKVDCYYVIDKNSPDYNRMKRYGRVIAALSDEHKILLPLADYIFTSQLNGWVENPYGDEEEYFRDIYHQAKVVFLQHGVTKDDHTKWLNRINQDCHAVVSSAESEQQAFLDGDYFYKPEQIWNTGMPRFDRLYKRRAKYILFVPTWRKGMMEQQYDDAVGIYKWVIKGNGAENQYFKRYSEILSDVTFITNCRKKGYKVCYMPHPLIEPYIKNMKISQNVEIIEKNTPWRDIFTKSAIMVTDYSSVAFDFAFLKRTIVYYQFDKNTFFTGHTYSKGYFDYVRDGFGEVVESREDLLEALYNAMERKGRMSDKYTQRVKEFYTYMDKKNCKRLYKKITEEQNDTRQL